MVRFLIDAQLPPGLARQLTACGYAAEHVNRIGLGHASDSVIWQYAIRTGATLVAKDDDFVALAVQDPDGPQVIWIRIGNIGNDALWRALSPLLEEIVQSLNVGERIIEVV